MGEPSDSGTNNKFKIGISLWLSFCLFACLWFLSRFLTGRRQLKNNLHVIEDGLRRMQEEIEKKQRDDSVGYGEDLEELLEELKKDMAETEGRSGKRTFLIFHQKFSRSYKMRNQKVGVDVWKMIFSSCSYLGLACAAWVLIKLICACFWLPTFLQKEDEKDKDALPKKEKKKESIEEVDETEILVQDKKND